MKLNDSGIPAALAAAVLFGAGTPLAKLLLEHAGPWLLAALLYLGSGLGLWLLRQVRQSPTTQLARGDWLWLAGAVFLGLGHNKNKTNKTNIKGLTATIS